MESHKGCIILLIITFFKQTALMQESNESFPICRMESTLLVSFCRMESTKGRKQRYMVKYYKTTHIIQINLCFICKIRCLIFSLKKQQNNIPISL